MGDGRIELKRLRLLIHTRRSIRSDHWASPIWALRVVPADVQDRAGGPPLMDRLHEAVKRLKVVWGDSHFDTALAHGWFMWAWVGGVVRKLVGQVRFVAQPKRWIVEIVCTQMTKADVLALRTGREDLADLDLVASHDDPIDEQFDKLPLLIEGGGIEAGWGLWGHPEQTSQTGLVICD